MQDLQVAAVQCAPRRVVEVPAEVSALTASLGDSARDINKNFYSYYNLGVVAALDGVRTLPDTTGKYAVQVPSPPAFTFPSPPPSPLFLLPLSSSFPSSHPSPLLILTLSSSSFPSLPPPPLLLIPALRLWRR